MDPYPAPVQRDGQRARLVVLYAELKGAAALAGRLPDEHWDVVICPWSLGVGAWLGDLQPDLILFHATGANELATTCGLLRSSTHLPVAVMAPADDDVLVASVLQGGIDEYLPVSIGDHELGARLAALHRRQQRYPTSETLRAGDVSLSLRDHTVERNGRKITLSPMEFRLLSCLVSAPGTVLTHQTLMARVWGAEYVDSRHYLRLYIGYLRDKLEDDPQKPSLILNEWGIGYRFQPRHSAAGSSLPA